MYAEAMFLSLFVAGALFSLVAYAQLLHRDESVRLYVTVALFAVGALITIGTYAGLIYLRFSLTELI